MRPGRRGAGAAGLRRDAALSPDSRRGPPHARGAGSEGARRGNGGQLIVRDPSCAPRGGSVRGEHCQQPGGLEAGTGWGTGAKETGSLILSGPRPGSSPGPGAAPGSPTPDGKFGAGLDLGRCCGIGFPRRGPPARSAWEAGCPGKPAPKPSRLPHPRLEHSPCSRHSGWARVGGYRWDPPHPSTHPGAVPFPPLWEELGVGASLCRQIGVRRGVRPGLG